MKTRKENYERLVEILERVNVEDRDELMEFVNKEMDKIQSKAGKLTAKQKENLELAEKVYEEIAGLELDEPKTLRDICKVSALCASMSAQKLAALAKKLKEQGKLVRTEEKGKSYWAVA